MLGVNRVRFPDTRSIFAESKPSPENLLEIAAKILDQYATPNG